MGQDSADLGAAFGLGFGINLEFDLALLACAIELDGLRRRLGAPAGGKVEGDGGGVCRGEIAERGNAEIDGIVGIGRQDAAAGFDRDGEGRGDGQRHILGANCCRGDDSFTAIEGVCRGSGYRPGRKWQSGGSRIFDGVDGVSLAIFAVEIGFGVDAVCWNGDAGMNGFGLAGFKSRNFLVARQRLPLNR